MTSANSQAEQFDEDQAPPVPLTEQQIVAIKAANPSLSPWLVVLVQAALGVVLAGFIWLVFDERAAVSAACGSLAVVLPGALFAKGITGRFARANVGAAVASFFLWEFVKILVTVAVMFAAYRWVVGLNWLAMLAGLIVTLKVYWLALAFKPKAGEVQKLTPNGKSN
jgi:ATP synthase protein I